ncbi:hypothetical protein RhiirA5_428277 [Rhizophagus irregularis]|uniref:Uncharacterized protein n=1 Tax=Rhizophagus irregularis TaxID=588596 RepID=A0A2N0P0M4_9GLOM|nr:hypothetical protein RhiirA5_428277 [Rhizophagus irregularis]
MNETIPSTAEQHSSNINNYNVIDDSSDNISSTFYTNHHSDQQPTYNESITSTLPPVKLWSKLSFDLIKILQDAVTAY